MRSRPQAVSAMAKPKPPHTTSLNMGVSATRRVPASRAISPSRTNFDSTKAVLRQNR